MLTPLLSGQILSASEAVLERLTDTAADVMTSQDKENLLRGLVAEYIHDEAFANAGIFFHKPIMSATYDRLVDEMYQDDKLALNLPGGGLASTHTISVREKDHWDSLIAEGKEVIIHSFIEMNEPFIVKYIGAISYTVLSQLIDKNDGKPVVRESKYDSSFCFNRRTAYTYALINQN